MLLSLDETYSYVLLFAMDKNTISLIFLYPEHNFYSREGDREKTKAAHPESAVWRNMISPTFFDGLCEMGMP